MLYCYFLLYFILQIEKLRSVISLLKEGRPTIFADCVLRARKLFEENYSNQIKQLLDHFPADYKNYEGNLFWSGTKRCPHPLEFDVSNVSLLLSFHYAINHISLETLYIWTLYNIF